MIKEVMDKHIADYSAMMESLTNIEKSMNSRLIEISQEKSKLDRLVADKKLDLEASSKLKSSLEESERILKDKISQAEINLSSLEDRIKACSDKEESLNKRTEAMVNEDRSLSERLQEIEKRERYVEIEERRLRFVDKKVKLLMQDKDISKQLEELE